MQRWDIVFCVFVLLFGLRRRQQFRQLELLNRPRKQRKEVSYYPHREKAEHNGKHKAVEQPAFNLVSDNEIYPHERKRPEHRMIMKRSRKIKPQRTQKRPCKTAAGTLYAEKMTPYASDTGNGRNQITGTKQKDEK